MPVIIKLILSGLWLKLKPINVLSWLALLVVLVCVLWLLIVWQPASAGALCPTSTPSHKMTPTPGATPTPTIYWLFVPMVLTDCPEGMMCVTEVTK